MKSLVKNSFCNIIYKCLNVVFPLFITAYASRVLLVDGVGKVASAQNIVSYFTIFAALGLPTYGVKAIAMVAGKKNKLSEMFTELFLINAVSTLMCSIFYYVMIGLTPYYHERWELFAVNGLLIVFNIINVDWFYQGKEEYQYIMLRSIAVKLLTLVATVLCVKESDDLLIYAAILTLSKVANYLFNIVNLRNHVYFSFTGINLKKHLVPICMLLMASLAVEIYTLADTTMLTFIHGDTVVGYYSTSIKVINAGKTVVIAICAVFLPRLSYYFSIGNNRAFTDLINKGIQILLFVSFPVSIGLICVAQDLMPMLFGTEFVGSVLSTKLLAVSVITVAFSNFFGSQVLITLGKEKTLLLSTIIGAIANIVLNMNLIFAYQHYGAAIASVITEFFVCMYQIYVIKRIVEVRICKKDVLSVIGASVSMTLIVTLLQICMIDTNVTIRFLTSILCGAFTYLTMAFVLKNTSMVELVEMIKHKL